jgi:FkbM family methyltransferase
MVWVALILALAGLAAAYVQSRYHSRLRRRIKQVEQLATDVRDELRAVYAERAETAAAKAGTPVRFPVSFTSQFGEDMLIWDLFAGKTQGFFIEAGAFDGRTLAVTYALEAAGWSGLLVEAIPELAENCRRIRPGSRIVQAALSKRGSKGTVKFEQMVDPKRAPHSGMVEGNREYSGHYYKRHQTTTIEVPVMTMDQALEGHAGPIDVVVLDVEGAEADVLDGFDLAKYRPRVLLIEDLSERKDPVVPGILEKAGYVRVGRLEVNDLYIRRDETALLERLKCVRPATMG